MAQAPQEHQPIAHVNVGDTFSGVYYVESVFVRKTKQNKDFQDYTLRDKSGSRFVKYWGVIDGITKGDFVFISANVEEYMGNPSIIAKNIAKEQTPQDLANYIPAFEDTDKYAEAFDRIIDTLKQIEAASGDDTAGRLVAEVYGNGAFFSKFTLAPGSARPHYGRQGGLLANTVRVAEQAIKTAESYGLTDQERAILVASAILCRIGAIDAYEFQDCLPVETKKGVLLGINNLTMTRVSSALKRVVSELAKAGQVPNQETVMRLLHAISSYSGNCMRPMTKESLILASVFRMDAEMVDAIEFIQNDVNVVEEFTAYDPALGRRYYTGCKTSA
jgi:23S rRNA maturation-related 3'-5' exoribonuclease YhaM